MSGEALVAGHRADGWLRAGRFACSAMLACVIGLGVGCYPLNGWMLAGCLGTYAGLLWWRPVSFLVVLPIVLPALDLGLWTGWMMVGEADFFMLATLAVLLARCPPRWSDVAPGGAWARRLAGIVLLALLVSWAIAVCAGLLSPLGAAHSDNAFLRPDNAVRLAKGLAEALVLLPFMRQRERCHGDAATWFGWGMAGGLIVVTLIVLAERALFAGILDFSAMYRVAGPFSSMRVGGGHIGAYSVLALPFALSLVRLRPRWLAAPLMLLACIAGGYTLAVTFARTAYAAGLIAMTVSGVLWTAGSRRRRRLGPGILVLAVAALVAAASTGGMRDRLAASARDFETRRANWQAGLAAHDGGVLAAVFGMGLGTYQRAMLMRSVIDRPSDIVVGRDAAGAYVTMLIESPFYLGQKIGLPQAGPMHLSLLARTSDDGTILAEGACDKVLLYSDNCRGGQVTLKPGDGWRMLMFVIPSEGLGGGIGWLRRPVELSLSGGPVGHRVDLRDIRLTDGAGNALMVNGDFGMGLDRWIFTDDSHVSWRMLNQYLMLWFETGALGLAAYLAFCGVALAGGFLAARAGAVAGACVAGSVSSFLISGLFDNVLEAPRLATLFFLVCLCGLLQWEAQLAGRHLAGRAPI